LIAQQSSLNLFPRINSGNAVAGGQNLPMPLHRLIFDLVFFMSKTCA
jgi:hypothetical protein